MREYLAKLSFEERFHKRYIPDPNSGCWLWTAASMPKGYGVMRWHDGMAYAHRISWMIHFGEIPDGLHVLHRCDVPSCVNPSHLFLGTEKDNAVDKVQKGRYFNGWSAKTHCTRGHVYESGSFYQYGNRRHCKTCTQERARKRVCMTMTAA